MGAIFMKNDFYNVKKKPPVIKRMTKAKTNNK